MSRQEPASTRSDSPLVKAKDAIAIDNSKINKLTGFSPQVSINDGLNKTIEWFTKSDNLKYYKAEIYNV